MLCVSMKIHSEEEYYCIQSFFGIEGAPPWLWALSEKCVELRVFGLA